MEWSNDATWPNEGRASETSSGYDEAMNARELAAMRGFGGGVVGVIRANDATVGWGP